MHIVQWLPGLRHPVILGIYYLAMIALCGFL